jgi:hypothetical protein
MGYHVWFTAGRFDERSTWHVFTDRRELPETAGTYSWTALCGFRRSFWESTADTPRLKLGDANPPIRDRCTRCDLQLKRNQRRKKGLSNVPGTW